MLGRLAERQKQIIQVMVNGLVDQAKEAGAQRLRLNLRALEVFVATARGGSTRAAAGAVARSQSAASSALAELERQLATQLFDRVGRRLVLNAQGQLLLPQAVALLEHAADVQALFESDQHTPLRMAASLTIGEYLLPELVASWKRAQPQAVVRLAVGNTRAVIDDVLALRVDLGFIEGTQTHADLLVRRWLDDELVIVAAPTHALAKARASHKQLAQATWVLREPGSGTRQAADSWLLERLAAHGPLRVEFELGSTEAIKRLVAAGVGLACLSRHTVQRSIEQGLLVEVQTRLPAARRHLAIVTRRGKRLPQAVLGFMRHCMTQA
jgi:DNA-binding transcriptional LysR family regulator